MKRILFLIESMSAESGGPAMEVVRLSNLLLEDNFEITIASLTDLKDSLIINTRVNYFKITEHNVFMPSWFKAINELKKLFSSNDVIFATGIWGAIDGFALRLAWRNDKPVYIRVCGMLEPYILARHRYKKIIARKLYVNHNLRQATGVIVNSSSEAINVKNLNVVEGKITVIPNGINLFTPNSTKESAKAYFGLSHDKRVLLYLGRIHPKKGLIFLLEAISNLKEKIGDLILLVAGDFSDDVYKKEINDYVKSNHLSEIVKFTGLATGEAKETHFNAADSFILPSQSEGLPNAVLEALSHGIPCIVTTGCNLPEISEYNAGLVVNLAIPNLENSILWFLNQDDFSILSENACKLISERFNPDDSVKEYVDIIKYS